MTRVTDLFVDAGMLAHEAGQLTDALTELAVRLDLAGAGDLLSAITDGTCWGAHDRHDRCPACGTVLKGTPNPHPKPTPPPKPPTDPKPGK